MLSFVDSNVSLGLRDLSGSIELGSKVDGLGVHLDVLVVDDDFVEPSYVFLRGGHSHDFGYVQFVPSDPIKKRIELKSFKKMARVFVRSALSPMKMFVQLQGFWQSK